MDLPTYTNIWRIEKRLYKLYDFRLPAPLPITWIGVFAGITVPYVFFLVAIGLPFNHNLVWLYVLPPGVLTWLTTRPVIESKRLPELVGSQLRYLSEPRTWCRLAPFAEKDDIFVSVRVWHRHPRRARPKATRKAATRARQAEKAQRAPAAAGSAAPVVATSQVAAAASPRAAGPRAAGPRAPGPRAASPRAAAVPPGRSASVLDVSTAGIPARGAAGVLVGRAAGLPVGSACAAGPAACSARRDADAGPAARYGAARGEADPGRAPAGRRAGAGRPPARARRRAAAGGDPATGMGRCAFGSQAGIQGAGGLARSRTRSARPVGAPARLLRPGRLADGRPGHVPRGGRLPGGRPVSRGRRLPGGRPVPGA